MNPLRLYRGTQLALLALLVAGVLVFWLVRAPEGTASDRILRDVALAGRMDGLVGETVTSVLGLAEAAANASAEELAAQRNSLEVIQTAVHRLQDELRDDPSSWIPVAEALDLLQQSQELSQESLARFATIAPSQPDAAGGNPPSSDPATDPALAHTPGEDAAILNARAQQLVEQSQRLRTRIEQAITEGMLARGTFWGLEAGQWLLGALVLSALLGCGVLAHAAWRTRLSPEKLERVELELIGRADRRAALRRCHERVRGLLELADSLCRGGKT